jgi:type VI secretion system protein ImpH
MRVLTRARRVQDPADAVRFHSPAGLVYPPSDVLDVRQHADGIPEVTVGLMGLTGPSGVMPRYYSEVVTQTLRARSTALRDFLDLLAHRFVAFFARGGVKYRPARAAEVAAPRGVSTQDPVARVLLALTCYGTPHLADRLAAGTEPLLHYAGLFALRPRSADRLGALMSDWLGMRVEVVEFAGAWLPLPPDQRTRLSAHGAWCRLGIDAAAGVRAWDPQARIILRIGPLDLRGFQRLLPDRVALQRLVSLVRAYVGFELGFAINPVLAAREVPPLLLDATSDPPPRLGWNTWVPGPKGGVAARTDAADAVFEAEVIEAQQVDWRSKDKAA